ncbi:hypothetical protein ACVXZ4_04230 [Lacisediminihabitans sp. FW035]
MDVDSTLNVPLAGNTRQTLSINNHPLLVQWRADYIARLAALSKLPEVEWFWATAWLYDAERHLDPLWGIESSGVLEWDADDERDAGQFGKSSAIRSMQEDFPCAWVFVDDWAISDELLRLPWWREMAQSADVLLIRCNQWTGVNAEEIGAIEAFVERWG